MFELTRPCPVSTSTRFRGVRAIPRPLHRQFPYCLVTPSRWTLGSLFSSRRTKLTILRRLLSCSTANDDSLEYIVYHKPISLASRMKPLIRSVMSVFSLIQCLYRPSMRRNNVRSNGGHSPYRRRRPQAWYIEYYLFLGGGGYS